MLPIQITVRDIPNSPAVEDRIRQKITKLSRYYQNINSCRVVITVPQKHKNHGKLFSVSIDITVPGKELAVNHKLDEDVYVAIRDAFLALQRQLENYTSKVRRDVKTHEVENHGTVDRLFPDEAYGFIQGIDGNEYYFSMSNMCYPSFEQLNQGDVVKFIPVPASDGLQAHHVTREK